ncbi:hypothetical protein J8273_3653 [Carpediemonas membranifera]|uniref:Nudix hydrolase domain-containing protein n=1 Tax=Carpediemonas membranifera TaxID=201153 RepID=A0A8J6AU25_9EUKA|nr:hypothetical protein J8273_3653 [Carpediemonas membranifera]|eukprot:KAG9394681.1 hypothetical protein J8273_3653 [Carpediemonas membranifera]
MSLHNYSNRHRFLSTTSQASFKVPTGQVSFQAPKRPIGPLSSDKMIPLLSKSSYDLNKHFRNTFNFSEESVARHLRRLLMPDTASVREGYSVDEIINAQVSVIIGGMSRDVSPSYEPWILFEHRSPDTNFPNDLCLAGGLVKASEMTDPRSAILREMEEEAALMVDGIRISGALRNIMLKRVDETHKGPRRRLINVIPIVTFSRRPIDSFKLDPQYREVQRLLAANFRSLLINSKHYATHEDILSDGPLLRDNLPAPLVKQWGKQGAVTLCTTPADYPYTNPVAFSQPRADDPVAVLDPYALRTVSLTEPDKPPAEQDLSYGLTGAIINRMVEVLLGGLKTMTPHRR